MKRLLCIGQWVLLCAWVVFLLLSKKDIIDYLKPISRIPFSVDMGVFGGAHSYFYMKGFSVPEEWGRWSDGPRAEISFIMKTQKGSSVTMLIFFNAIAGPNHRQVFEFIFNGRLLKKAAYTTPHDHFLALDITELLQESNHLLINISRPTIPRSLDPQSGDTRRLGIGIKRITFVPGSCANPTEAAP